MIMETDKIVDESKSQVSSTLHNFKFNFSQFSNNPNPIRESGNRIDPP